MFLIAIISVNLIFTILGWNYLPRFFYIYPHFLRCRYILPVTKQCVIGKVLAVTHLPVFLMRALNNYHYLSFRAEREILSDVNHEDFSSLTLLEITKFKVFLIREDPSSRCWAAAQSGVNQILRFLSRRRESCFPDEALPLWRGRSFPGPSP